MSLSLCVWRSDICRNPGRVSSWMGLAYLYWLLAVVVSSAVQRDELLLRRYRDDFLLPGEVDRDVDDTGSAGGPVIGGDIGVPLSSPMTDVGAATSGGGERVPSLAVACPPLSSEMDAVSATLGGEAGDLPPLRRCGRTTEWRSRCLRRVVLRQLLQRASACSLAALAIVQPAAMSVGRSGGGASSGGANGGSGDGALSGTATPADAPRSQFLDNVIRRVVVYYSDVCALLLNVCR